MASVLEPFQLGPFRLSSRIVMAPMTRSRARTGVPDDLKAVQDEAGKWQFLHKDGTPY